MYPSAITSLNATSSVAGQITLSWLGGLGNNVKYSYALSTGTIQSVSGISSPVTLTLTTTDSVTTTVTLTATVIGGSASAVSNSVTTTSPYKTPSVTSGLVLHSDFLNPTTYSGTGTTFYNLVDSAAQSIMLGGAGSYSYSSPYLIITNPTQGSFGTYLLSASYSVQTISLWLKINDTDTRYLYDSRNISGATAFYLYYNSTGGISTNVTSVFINGGASNLSAILPIGSLFNITFVLGSAVTGNAMLGNSNTNNLNFNVSIARIVMYNRALSQSENAANYSALV